MGGNGGQHGIQSNLNFYWLVGSILGIWFLFIHAPKYLSTRDDPITIGLVLHLFGVVPIYIVCIHNTLITPSTFEHAYSRTAHVWLGRIGIVLGFFGFVSGVILEWFIFDSDFGSIPITIGGTIQTIAQLFGWYYIKKYQKIKQQIKDIENEEQEEAKEEQEGEKPATGGEAGEEEAEGEGDTEEPPPKRHQQERDDIDRMDKLSSLYKQRDRALKSHVGNMISVFFFGCGIPAIMRLDSVTFNALWSLFTLLGIAIVLCILHIRLFESRIDENTKSTNTTKANNNNETTITAS